MHKFIQSNKNRNSLVFVTKYDWPIENYLKGKAILVHLNCLEDIQNIIRNVDEATKIVGFVYKDDYASLETIDVNPNWGNLPIVLYINRLGQYCNIHHKINILKSLNVIVIFTAREEYSTRDAQILSSLGIHSGILLSKDSELSEHVLDLLTYSFYGNFPHAEIEPFSSICKYYDGENYVSPSYAYFVNPHRYIYINKEMKLGLSQKDLDDNNSYNFEDIEKGEIFKIIDKDQLKWQSYFIESHPCTFCPAFRICLGYFDYKKNNNKCKEVMSELLEAIEFFKKTKIQNAIEKCQP